MRRAGTFGGNNVLIILAWVFGTAFTAVSIGGLLMGSLVDIFGIHRNLWLLRGAL